MAEKNEFLEINTEAELLNLQRNFAEIIRRPLLNQKKMSPDPRSEKIVSGNEQTDPHQRMEFYAQQYWWRIIDSFDADFICLSRVVDKKTYTRIRNSYLEKCLSQSFTLRNLGRNFPNYLENNYQILGLKRDLADLILDASRFDWARIEAFDAAEYPTLTTTDIAAPEFSKKNLYLQPFVKLLKFKSEVDTLFKSGTRITKETTSNTSLERNETPEKQTQTANPIKNNINVAVYRRAGKLASTRLNKEEYQYLQTLKSGASLIKLLETVSELEPTKEGELYLFFQKLMALSMLTFSSGEAEE